MTPWQPAYVGLGSNLGDSAAIVRCAFESLATIAQTRVIARSRLFRTAPFGPVQQPHFVNAAAGLLTQLEPRALLAQLRDIEIALGREPVRVRWGPRTIDLDLLVLGRERLDDSDLRLPHPGIAARAFVLVPLADIARDLDVPGAGRVSDLLARVDTRVTEALP